MGGVTYITKIILSTSWIYFRDKVREAILNNLNISARDSSASVS
jgi:hypothetical protein